MHELEDTHFWFVGKRYFVSAILDNHKSQIKEVLDLGSGTGGMTKYLEKYGKIRGVEINKIAINLAQKRGLKIRKGNVQNLRLGQKKFDLITIFDVLYHKNIKDEKKIFKKIKNNMSKNGYLLITDAALPILASKHDKALSGKRRYKLSDMEKLLNNSDYKIIKKSYIFFSIFPVIFIKRLFLDKLFKNKASDVKPISKFLNYFLLKILYIESIFLKYFSMPIGSSILVLAQKNK